MTLEFLVTTFIITASPGTGVVYTLANALSRGAKASTIAAFGCTLGIIPHLLAAIGGLAAILHTSAVIFEIFRYAGVAYLLYRENCRRARRFGSSSMPFFSISLTRSFPCSFWPSCRSSSGSAILSRSSACFF
jgi:arginine exporter protein ArgO